MKTSLLQQSDKHGGISQVNNSFKGLMKLVYTVLILLKIVCGSSSF